MGTALDVLKVAQSQIGYKESPKNSNKTKYGAELGLNGQPWCAVFVKWSFIHGGCGNLYAPIKQWAYCPSVADYYIAHKQTVSKSSGKPGDIVLFSFGHANSQHIGIIEKKNSDGSYTCIEGNTSVGNNCNGGAVMRRTRYKSQISWIVRPNYSGTSSIKKPTGQYDGTIPAPTIQNKSEGAKVKNLQKFLNWYCNEKLDVDGEFGPATESALIMFQLTEGIEADGVYGKDSQSKAKAYKATKKKTTTETKAKTTTKKKSTKK